MRKLYRPLVHISNIFRGHGKGRALPSTRNLYSLQNEQKGEPVEEKFLKKSPAESSSNRFALFSSFDPIQNLRNFLNGENPFVGLRNKVKDVEGNYDETISFLRRIFEHPDKESDLRKNAFWLMGKALCNLGQNEEAEKCWELAANLLKKYEGNNPQTVAQAYTEIAMLHERMRNFGEAVFFYKKVIEMFERCDHDIHAEADAKARLGWSLYGDYKEEEAVFYLESALKLLKKCFGPRHVEVGHVYYNLGLAYVSLDRFKEALKMYGMAREIMLVALGPHHMDTIDATRKLASVHRAMAREIVENARRPHHMDTIDATRELADADDFMRSYELAIGFQKQVVQELKNHGPSVKIKLEKAEGYLAYLKAEAGGQRKRREDDMLEQSSSEEQLENKDVTENRIEYRYCVRTVKAFLQTRRWNPGQRPIPTTYTIQLPIRRRR